MTESVRPPSARPPEQGAPLPRSGGVAWRRIGHFFLDVLFTFLLPYVLLNPVPFGLPDLTPWLGAYGVYVLAGLVPTVYIVLDTLRHRVLNPFTLFLMAGALSGAVVSFLRLDGVAFALKDAVHSGLLVLVALGSLLIRRPLFELLYFGVVAPESPQRARLLRSALSRVRVRRALVWATLLVAVKGILLGGASFLVALRVVTLPFGVPGFNAQVAAAHAITFPLALVLDLLFYGGAALLVLAATRRLTGGRAWPWQDGFWRELEALRQGHGD